MVTYQAENYTDVIGEAGPLLIAHWQDVALDQDTIDLQPDWEKYEILNNANKLHITTARETGTGKLVGYVVYILDNCLHYKQVNMADGDIFWLDPEYRKGLTGVKLLKSAEKYLVGLGVNKIFNKVKLHKDVGKIFERLGYTPIERVYAKGIK